MSTLDKLVGKKSSDHGRRKKPGEGKGGDYYRIVAKPKEMFSSFRYHDVGDPGHIVRLAGKKESGRWETQAWLVSKGDAHVRDEKLVPDTKDAKELISSLGSEPEHVKGDIFRI